MQWKKIILVDDDAVTSQVHKRLIDYIGYDGEVVLLPDGSKAMNYIQSHLTQSGVKKKNGLKDLVLLDLNMPGTNGWHFMQQFRKFDKKTKNKFRIVMVSSSIHPDDIEPIKLIPEIAEYIIKPLSVDRLKNLIYG